MSDDGNPSSRDADLETEPPAEASEPTEPEDPIWARETAPQSAYTMRQVGIGLVVFVLLAILAFGVPLAFA